MSDDDLDPGADTQMFQAFVDRRDLDEQQARSRQGSRSRWVALAVLVALVIVAVLAWLLLGR